VTRKEKKLQGLLNRIIDTSLYGPGGDPDEHNLRAAACAFLVLKELNLKIRSETEVEKTLRSDNIYEDDALKEHE
jgi:hypothetical protein